MSNLKSSVGNHADDQVWTVLSMLEWATRYFAEKNVSNPRLSIEWLLSDLLSVKRLDLYLQFDRPLTKDQLSTLRGWVLRRGKHEPLQYITGSTDFHHCTIKVDKRALIPRPETEELVEMILAQHQSAHATVVDFGSGSGCIAIALKKARPNWDLIGVDLDPGALELARQNGELNGVQVEWLLGDMLDAPNLLKDRSVDVVVSNPPYIEPEESATLDAEVRDFEPALALFHADPMALYDSLLSFAASQEPPASLFCETHFAIGERLLDRLHQPGYTVDIQKDYNGKDRFLVAKFRHPVS